MTSRVRRSTLAALLLLVCCPDAASHASRSSHPQATPAAAPSSRGVGEFPFGPRGKSGLFVLYYGPLVDPLSDEEKEVRKRIRDTRPNFVVVADVYYNNSRVPDFFHSDASGPTLIRVLAYVATGEGRLNINRVLGRVQAAMTAGYDGIFFDEVSNAADPATVNFYSAVAREVRRFGGDNLVVFNPGTHTINGGLFEQADIVSVENNTDDPKAAKPSDFSSPPRLSAPAKAKIEPWRWLAVQGHPARLAASGAGEAVKRLEDFRKAGGFWYYSPHNAPKGKPPTGQPGESTHTQLPDWFESFAAAVNSKGGPACPP